VPSKEEMSENAWYSSGVELSMSPTRGDANF
jgi:hypothetical protein